MVDRAQRLHRARGLAFAGAKRAEVVLADQHAGSAAHGIDLQRVEHPAHQAGLERRPHRRLQQHVAVAPATCLVARMEVRRHRLAPLHRDVARQVAVGAAHPRERLALDRRVEVHHLVQRVHAGVGAAGTDGAHRRIGETRQARARGDPARCRHRAGSASRCTRCRGSSAPGPNGPQRMVVSQPSPSEHRGSGFAGPLVLSPRGGSGR